MTFPTVPTGSRFQLAGQADTTATRTFPDLSTVTKNSGDLLIALICAYQTGTGTNAAFSGWTGGFTEFFDSATTTTMAMGGAYKWSTGSETGTFAVTQAAAITGHASMVVLSIAGAHPSTPPEAGGRADGTASAADPTSLNPAGWGTEDTLWILFAGNGETATTGSWLSLTNTPPANYTDSFATTGTADVVGGVGIAAGFRQLNAASEDPAAWTNQDLSNTRNAAIVIAVRPAPDPVPRPTLIVIDQAVGRSYSY